VAWACAPIALASGAAGLGTVASALFFISSLPFLPMADATAINFISPILITALAVLFLQEQVGWRRWTAALVGLLGVLIVIRPGTGAFQMAALLPLLAAASWAGTAIVTRLMSGTDQPTTTLTYSALVGLGVLTVMMPFVWVTPTWTEVGLALVMGLLSTAGHGLVVLGYRHASASVVAPFSYVQLIWAGALGFLVFGSLPDQFTFLGPASLLPAACTRPTASGFGARSEPHREVEGGTETRRLSLQTPDRRFRHHTILSPEGCVSPKGRGRSKSGS
jgi:drug/metabolite transporter (DMT)-like permease